MAMSWRGQHASAIANNSNKHTMMSVGDWLTEPQGPSFLVILPKQTSYSEITTSLSKIQKKRKDRIGQQKRTPYSSQLPSPAAAAIKRRSRGYAVATLPSISLLLYVEHANNLARPAERTHIDRLIKKPWPRRPAATRAKAAVPHLSCRGPGWWKAGSTCSTSWATTRQWRC